MPRKKINLLIPIAGKAQRFLDEGYRMPKPLIMVKDELMIERAMTSVSWDDCNLIFVVRRDHIHSFSIDKILLSADNFAFTFEQTYVTLTPLFLVAILFFFKHSERVGT